MIYLDTSSVSNLDKPAQDTPSKVVKGKSVLQEKLETLAKRIGYIGKCGICDGFIVAEWF